MAEDIHCAFCGDVLDPGRAFVFLLGDHRPKDQLAPAPGAAERSWASPADDDGPLLVCGICRHGIRENAAAVQADDSADREVAVAILAALVVSAAVAVGWAALAR